MTGVAAPRAVHPLRPGAAGGMPPRIRPLDWRFLLPRRGEGAFEHLVLLGGSAEMVGEAGRLGLATHVSDELPRARVADALVLLSGAVVSLAEAVSRLRPGGALYCEFVVPRHRSDPARGLRRSFGRLGLSTTGLYWVRPNFADRQMYLPLDARGALPWYVATLFHPHTPFQRMLAPWLPAVARVGGPILRARSRCLAVTAVAGPAADAPAAVLGDPSLPAALRSAGARPLILTAGRHDLNRVVVLPFSRRGRRPLAVLKLCRVAESNRQVVGEQAALVEVRSRLDAAMRDTLPAPLGLHRCDALVVGVESYAPGRVLAASLGRWGASLRAQVDGFEQAVAWLTEFHRQAAIRREAWTEADVDRWIDRPLRDYEAAVATTRPERRLFAELRRRGSTLIGAVVPIVWQHFAFGPGNICRSGARIRVIDWETAEPGLPVGDALYLALHWSTGVRSLRGLDAELRGFEELFCTPERAPRVAGPVGRAVARYLAGLDVDPRLVPIALVLLWVVHALGRVERARRLGLPVDRAAGEPYVSYVHTLAVHRERLFGGGVDGRARA